MNEAINMMNCSLDSSLNLTGNVTTANYTTGNSSLLNTSGTGTLTINSDCNGAWGYWQNYYYPQVIRESYPVYIKERAEDKGKQAFEIIKHLQDKHLMKLDTVKDFVEAMDCLLKIL